MLVCVRLGMFCFAVVEDLCLCDNSMSYSPGCSPIMRRRRSLIVKETPLPLSPKNPNPKRTRVLKHKPKKSPAHKSPSCRGKMLKHPLLDLQCKAGKEGETDSSEENSSDDADQSNLSNVSVFTIYFNFHNREQVSCGQDHPDGSFSAYRLGQSSQAEQHGFTVPMNQVRLG